MGRNIRKKITQNIKPRDSTVSHVDLSMRPNREVDTRYERRMAADVLNITIFDDQKRGVDHSINRFQIKEETNDQFNYELDFQI